MLVATAVVLGLALIGLALLFRRGYMSRRLLERRVANNSHSQAAV